MVQITWKIGDYIFMDRTASSMGRGKKHKVTKLTEQFTIVRGGLRCEHKFINPIQKPPKKAAKIVVPPVIPPIPAQVPQNQRDLVHLRNEVVHLRGEISDVKSQMTEMQEMFASKLQIISELLDSKLQTVSDVLEIN